VSRVKFNHQELTTSILRLAIALEKLKVLPSERADNGVCGCLASEAEINGGELIELSASGMSKCLS
jgi:hypothetical protein